MRVEKYVYFNGSRKKQLEIVDYIADDEPTRFGNKYTDAIKDKI